jgi:hypothetical protein
MTSDSASPRERIPSYAAAMGTYAAAFGTAALVGRSGGRRFTQRYAVQDLVLGAMATHKVTRLVSKDGVTTPLRAPFTTFEGEAGSAEVEERPRETSHTRHTIGELLTCPFCLAPWVAGGYVAALHLAPGPARAWAAVFSLVAGSDWLQQGYGHLRTD